MLTIGIVQQQVKAVHSPQDKLDVGSSDLDHAIFSREACQEGGEKGQHQNHVNKCLYVITITTLQNIRSYRPPQPCLYTQPTYDHFNSISSSLAVENEVVVRRASLATQIINEQNDLVLLALRRSQQSFQKLSSLVHKLCSSLSHYNKHDPLVDAAFQEMESEHQQWAQLQRCMGVRKMRLNSKSLKFKSGKIKRFNQHHFEDQQTRFPARQQYKISSSKSEAVTKMEGTLTSIAGRDDLDLQHKMKLREQFYTIKEFVVKNLAPMMEYADGYEVPKKIILNIYMSWNRQLSRSCLIDDTGKIQMQLTNQLKLCFPRISMNRKSFKGVQFRGDFTQQLQLTDRSPPPNEAAQLLQYQDPVNELLREGNELNAADGQCEKQEWLDNLGHDLYFDE